jgi:uncharacterized membrane protein
MIYIKAYFGALLTFSVMDAIWLGSIATDFYFGQLGSLLRDEPNWLAAIIFYLLYIFGIVYFSIRPSLKSGNFKTVLRDGCLLGLLAYATYDMTNLATVTNWPIIVTIVDIIWGVIITSSSAISGYIFAKKFGGRDTKE